MLRVVFLLCVICGFSAPARAGELEEDFVTLLKEKAYLKVDMIACEPDIRAYVRAAEAGGGVNEHRALVKRGCLDPYTRVHLKGSSRGDSAYARYVEDLKAHPVVAWRTATFLYLNIRFFSNKTYDLVLQELADVGSRAIIIDMRNNPGGLVKAFVETASLFAPYHGVPIGTEKTVRGEIRLYSKVGVITPRPIAILINKKTGSSAELFVATLKFWYGPLVLLIGEKTYGKGAVQTPFSEEGGDVTHLITTAIFLVGVPGNHVPIQGVGISPDTWIVGGKEKLSLKDDPAVSYAIGLFQ